MLNVNVFLSSLTLRYTNHMSEAHRGLPMLGLHEFIINISKVSDSTNNLI